jgi:hypothetical protein
MTWRRVRSAPSQVGARAEGVGGVVLEAGDHHVTGLAVAAFVWDVDVGQVDADGDGCGERHRQVALAEPRVAADRGELADGDAAFPQERDRLGCDVGEPADDQLGLGWRAVAGRLRRRTGFVARAVAGLERVGAA